MKFLRERVFEPLHMEGVVDFDAGQMTPADPHGYSRFALGPARPAAYEAPGWMFAAGELAMPAKDLALWDISEIEHSLLSPASYAAQVDPVILTSGKSSNYGLGLFVRRENGRLRFEHGGEVSGFLSENRIYPEDKAAIVVLTNSDFGDASGAIADGIEQALFSKAADPPAGDAAKTRAARALYDELRTGRLDRTRLTANGADYFSAQAVRDFQDSLGPLGEPTGFRLTHSALRGGMTVEVYEVDYPDRKLQIILRALPDGKVEQFMVSPKAG
jgi:CubicO group peptidase (beta-lactamase class C family)